MRLVQVSMVELACAAPRDTGQAPEACPSAAALAMLSRRSVATPLRVKRFNPQAQLLSVLASSTIGDAAGFGSPPVSMPSRSSASSAPGMPLRLERSIFRRWPKAAPVTFSRVPRSTPAGMAVGTTCTTAEVTLGGGTNAERLTVSAILGDARHWDATARRP